MHRSQNSIFDLFWPNLKSICLIFMQFFIYWADCTWPDHCLFRNEPVLDQYLGTSHINMKMLVVEKHFFHQWQFVVSISWIQIEIRFFQFRKAFHQKTNMGPLNKAYLISTTKYRLYFNPNIDFIWVSVTVLGQPVIVYRTTNLDYFYINYIKQFNSYKLFKNNSLKINWPLIISARFNCSKMTSTGLIFRLNSADTFK